VFDGGALAIVRSERRRTGAKLLGRHCGSGYHFAGQGRAFGQWLVIRHVDVAGRRTPALRLPALR
jgi:hypothetical protein